jgi:hypothetical protein
MPVAAATAAVLTKLGILDGHELVRVRGWEGRRGVPSDTHRVLRVTWERVTTV